MTFSWTEPFTIGVGEGWELLIYGQAVADHQGRSLAVFGLIACLNQRPFGCGVGGVGLLRQQVVLAGQPEIQPIRWAELNELAGWTNLRSDPFPGSPRLPPLPGGRVGPFLGFPVAKRVKSGASKSVNSGTLALARSLHDGPWRATLAGERRRISDSRLFGMSLLTRPISGLKPDGSDGNFCASSACPSTTPCAGLSQRKSAKPTTGGRCGLKPSAPAVD